MTRNDICRSDICHFYVAEGRVSMSSHSPCPDGFPNDETSLSLILWSRALLSFLHPISLPASIEPLARGIKLYCIKLLRSLGLFIIDA